MNEDKAARYHRLRRRSVMLGAAWSLLLLAGLLLTGLSHALRHGAAAIAASSGLPHTVLHPVTVALWVVAVEIVHEAGALPFAFYGGFLLDRRYGLSRQAAGEWWRDHLKAFALASVFGVVAGVFVYGAMALWPDGWWILAWIAAVAVTVLLAWCAPVLLLPLFFRCVPLGNEALRRRLLALAERVGVPAIDIYEWRLSDRTSRANAMLTGIGRTRRILISDTLVADYEDDEVEVILAHELAHHANHDVWRGLAFEGVVAGVALWAASRVLTVVVGPLGLDGLDDVAGAPAIALTLMAVSAVMLPVANALSRRHEWRADRMALEATRNSEAFVSAMRRLGARNLAEESPAWLVRLFFHTHPPIAERVAFARAWQAGQPPRPASPLLQTPRG